MKANWKRLLDNAKKMSVQSNWIKDLHSLTVAAHRGALGYQNTFEAFCKASKYGVKAVEFDVWIAKANSHHDSNENGVPVIIHGGPNGEIQHSSPEFGVDKSWLINSLSVEQVKSIKLPNGQKIPLLEEFMDEFKSKFYIIIDFKDKNTVSWEILLNTIFDKAYNQNDDIINSTKNIDIFSVHTAQIDILSELIKQKLDLGLIDQNNYPKVGYWFWNNESFKQNHTWHRHPKIELAYSCITAELVNDIKHEKGMQIYAFFMPYEEESVEAYTNLISLGVDWIETDRPLELSALINQILSSECEDSKFY